jgi:hypothetical protein
VLDGELVVPDLNGRSDFEEVRRRNLLLGPFSFLLLASHLTMSAPSRPPSFA